MNKSYFQRSAAALGADVFQRLAAARVIIFGVGGVGSWCAEALVRTGVQRLTLVDDDVVAPSNINRQLPATVQALGRKKVDVLRERLLSINPDAHITALATRYTPGSASSFALADYEFCIDAIDSVADKTHLLLHATSLPTLQLFSSMGAARRLKPECVRTAEFWKVAGCPLAAALRRSLRRAGTLPARPFLCVYSDEPVPPQEEGGTKGSLMHVTATFGMHLAGLVVRACCEA